MTNIKSPSQVSHQFIFPLWLTGRPGRIGVALILYTLVFLAWTYFHWGGEENISLIGNLAILPPMFTAVLMAWRVAMEKQLDPRLRRAWFLLGLGTFLVFLGEATWTYFENILHVDPFPSVADIFFLGYYPLVLWGVLTLPSAPQNRHERLIFGLDLIIVMISASMFVGYFLIIPTAVVNSSDLLSQLLATAYPIWSLILLGGVLALLLRPSESDTRSVLLLLLAGFSFFLASDLSFGYASLAETYVVGSWIDTGWHIAQVFVVLAALRQLHRAPVVVTSPHWLTFLNSFVRRIPVIAVGMGYGLVFYVLLANFNQAAVWLLAGALLLTLLLITRQMVSPAFADLPIRTKLILTFIFVSGLSISLVALVSYLTIRSNLQSSVGTSMKAHARDGAEAISNLLAKQADALEGFVLSSVIQKQAATGSAAYGTDDLTVIWEQLGQRDLAWRAAANSDLLVQATLNNEAADELHKFQSNFPGYIDLLLTDKYGAVLAATTRPSIYDQSILSWWQSGFYKGQGAVYLSQPILDPITESHHLIIVIPIYAHLDSDLVGILMATYSLRELEQRLVSQGSGSMAGDHLLLPTGQILTSSDQFVFLEQNTLQNLQDTAATNFATMNLEGKSQLVSQASVTATDPEEVMAFEGLNWKFLTHQDPAEAFAPLNAAWKTTLLSTLVVLFLTIGVAAVLAQILVAPISRLKQAAEGITKGDLSTQVQVESRDEIGTLASTFNSMLDALSRTQKELQESEALYRSLVDYSPDMIAVHSQGRVDFINPAGVRLLGAESADELIGQPMLDIIPPQDRESAQQGLEDIQATGQPTPLMEQKMHRRDGTSFEAELRAIPISFAGGPAIQFVMRDITERKNAQEKIHQLLAQVARQRGDLEVRVAERTEELNGLNQRLQNELIERNQLMHSLHDSEERFRMLFDASPDAIFLIDPHNPDTLWPIVDCNQAAGRMNGYAREELIGQSINILNTRKEDPDGFTTALERLRREGALYALEAEHLHKDGHTFPIEYSTTLIKSGDRELVLGIDRDITERKHAEEALNQAKDAAEESRRVAEAASGAKSEFLSRMSHELRTPMNAILGFAQLLEMSHKEPLSSIQKERVRQIAKGGQHLLDLINEILDISRIEANRVQISPEPVSVRESIQEVLDLTVPLAVKRHIQVVTKFDNINANPFVMADRQRFKQVLLNLLGNAVKYNYDGGSVIIACESTPVNKWRISISDSGPGISQENLTRLFTPFERLEPDRPNIEGTGLGLVLAKRLVEMMQGQIGVDSMVGRGSTFWVELPSTESPVERLERMGGTGGLPAISTRARKILYVEDNIANFELIQQVLADYSQIKLLWATDAKTGLETALGHRPNLILLDLHLGGTDGAEVLQQLKQDKRTAGIPVVVVSADATSGQVERLISMGAEAYLTKPLNVKHFIRLIEESLGEKAI